MSPKVDLERVWLASKAVRAELFAERNSRGYWEGYLASSPPATAAAVSALVSAHRRDTGAALRESRLGASPAIEQVVQGDLSEFLVDSLHWLARHQNADGGWGDCLGARSNVAATMLVQAALRMTGVPAKYADLIDRAEDYVAASGGVAGLWQTHGDDKALVAAILANCALAGMVSWRQVPTLPFELLCVPQRWRSHWQTLTPRHATPTMLAVGMAKWHHDPPRNPIMRLVRRSLAATALGALERLQAADDSFLASVPLTAFVVMSLASIGHQQHTIVERGIEFLLATVRGDASWSVEVNRSVTNTMLALDGLLQPRPTPLTGEGIDSLADHPAAAPSTQRSAIRHAMPWQRAEHLGDVAHNAPPLPRAADWHQSGAAFERLPDDGRHVSLEASLNWLLDCQRSEPDPLTEAPPGGWASSDAPGALPNTADTASALVVLAACSHSSRLAPQRLELAARRGVAWLLGAQNGDGGWPTLYRDSHPPHPDTQSGTDLTAQALRALAAWHGQWRSKRPDLRILAAIDRGWQFLQTRQLDDGSFVPLRFGNEQQLGGHNLVCGTSVVLITCEALQRLDTELARRAAGWLVSAQHASGGWGPPRARRDYSGTDKDGLTAWRMNELRAKCCSVEESALALTALLPLADKDRTCSIAVARSLTWLAEAVEQDAHRRPAVIGFYLPKMWYHERLYPLTFAAWALSRALRQFEPQRVTVAPAGSR